MFAVRSTPAVRVSAVAGRALGAKKFNPLAAHVARKAPVAKARFSVSANSGPPSADGSVDIYRDTPLRYMGYANEVGESFVAFLPVWGVPATYGVAGTYARLESMRAREFTRIRLFRQKKKKGHAAPHGANPRPPIRAPKPPKLTHPTRSPVPSDQRSTCSRTPWTRARRRTTAKQVRALSLFGVIFTSKRMCFVIHEKSTGKQSHFIFPSGDQIRRRRLVSIDGPE